MSKFSITKRPRASSRALLATAAAAVLLTVAACGSSESDSGGSDSSAPGDPEAVAQAKERIQPLLEKPTTIAAKTPLTEKPEEGKTLYLIRYNFPIAALLDAPHKEATEALGWTLKVLAVDAADPLSQANAVKQAIAGGADFIEISSASVRSIGEGVDAAKKAGIPIFLQAGETAAEGEKNWIFGNSNEDYVNDLMMRLLDFAIVDSNGTANVLNLSAPDYPILAAMNDHVEKEFPKNCASCTIQTENVSAADLMAGKSAELAVAALRKNPDLNYVAVAAESSADGLPQALKAAGLDKKVKVLVLGASKGMPAGLQDGSFAALAMQEEDSMAWNAVDMSARYSLGMEATSEEHAVNPGWLWTKENAPKGETRFAGADGYQDMYKELWKVTS